MITYISTWARQVILAVIIGIMLEMILSQNSKTTKYIKTVIGVYVMYAIIVPGINLINGKKIDFSKFDYDQYLTNSDIYSKMEENINEIAESNFKESYELNLKQDIENKLNKMGFVVSSIKLEIELDEESEEYGVIKEIKIGISKKEDKSDDKKEISVNKIEIGETVINENNLSENEKNEIKTFLNQEYGIVYEKIIIV